MAKFGTGGIVRLRIAAREVEYKIAGSESSALPTMSVSAGRIDGPNEGPSAGASIGIGTSGITGVACGFSGSRLAPWSFRISQCRC